MTTHLEVDRRAVRDRTSDQHQPAAAVAAVTPAEGENAADDVRPPRSQRAQQHQQCERARQRIGRTARCLARSLVCGVSWEGGGAVNKKRVDGNCGDGVEMAS